MATQRQIAANRRNSRKSTGPKTAAGKAAAAVNGLQHGVFSTAALLPGENDSDFAAVRQAYLNQYKPATPTEYFLVMRIVSAAWRLHRLGPMEVRILAAQHWAAEEKSDLNGDILRVVRFLYSKPNPAAPSEEIVVEAPEEKDETAQDDENDDNDDEDALKPGGRGHGPGRAAPLPLAERVQASTAAVNPRDHVAHAYIRDSQNGNTIFKFARYQTALERSFYRAVHELERLRAQSDSPTPATKTKGVQIKKS